jgi:hypothetical protein
MAWVTQNFREQVRTLSMELSAIVRRTLEDRQMDELRLIAARHPLKHVRFVIFFAWTREERRAKKAGGDREFESLATLAFDLVVNHERYQHVVLDLLGEMQKEHRNFSWGLVAESIPREFPQKPATQALAKQFPIHPLDPRILGSLGISDQ